MLNNAQNINDLRVPPANRLEKLTGDYSGYHSIRINKQWRIVFIWENENAYNSKEIFISQTRIREIIKGKRRITADTALRLSKYFGTSAKFWL